MSIYDKFALFAIKRQHGTGFEKLCGWAEGQDDEFQPEDTARGKA